MRNNTINPFALFTSYRTTETAFKSELDKIDERIRLNDLERIDLKHARNAIQEKISVTKTAAGLFNVNDLYDAAK